MAREKRKDSNGIVLRPGEYQIKGKNSYEYKWRNAEGRQCSVSAQTLEELREREAKVKLDQLSGLQTGKRETLNDYFEVYKQTKRGIRLSTKNNYIYMYEHFVKNSRLGRMKIVDIKRRDIITFYSRLVDSDKMAVSTLDTLQNVIHPILDMAVMDDLVRRNVSDKILAEFKKEDKERKKREELIQGEKVESLLLDEQARFLECIKGTRWQPILTIALLTGMRCAEITGLIWDDIDTVNNVIHIRRNHVYYEDQTTGKCENHINLTKTDVSYRELPLSDELLELFEMERKEGFGCTDTIDGVSGFIFGNRHHHTFKQDTLNRAIKRIRIEANSQKDAKVLIPHFTMHKLRKTYATNLVRSGADVPRLMALLGHNDPDTTLKVYVQATKDIKYEADAKMREMLKKNLSEQSEQSSELESELSNVE